MIALELRGVRTRYSSTRSLPPGLFRLSFGTLILGKWNPCTLRRLWSCPSKGPSLYVVHRIYTLRCHQSRFLSETAKARAKDKEKKAIEGLRFVEDELRVVKEEFQAAREELCTKAAALDRAP